MIDHAVISDIHVYHRRTPTPHIISSFWRWVEEHYTVLSKIDVLFIAGDIFDRTISSNHPHIRLVSIWLYQLGLWCKKHHVALRVLEGTTIHDRRQMENHIHALEGIPELDVRYVSTVSVETYRDTTILYVPDNWKPTAEETYNDVVEVIHQTGLTQVDIAIMHGGFGHQLPVTDQHTHNARAYSALVDKFIHVGHIHIPSRKGKISAQGSFDRVAHNEEHDKGGTIVIKGRLQRLINHHSYPYRQLHLPEALVDAMILVEQVAESVANGAWLQVICSRHHPLLPHLHTLTLKYPQVRFERKFVDEVTLSTQPIFTPHTFNTTTALDTFTNWLTETHKDIEPGAIIPYIHQLLQGDT